MEHIQQVNELKIIFPSLSSHISHVVVCALTLTFPLCCCYSGLLISILHTANIARAQVQVASNAHCRIWDKEQVSEGALGGCTERKSEQHVKNFVCEKSQRFRWKTLVPVQHFSVKFELMKLWKCHHKRAETAKLSQTLNEFSRSHAAGNCTQTQLG